jgi:hypothetical protein
MNHLKMATAIASLGPNKTEIRNWAVISWPMLEVAMHFLTPKQDSKKVITTARSLQEKVGERLERKLMPVELVILSRLIRVLGEPARTSGIAERYVIEPKAFLQFDDEVTP